MIYILLSRKGLKLIASTNYGRVWDHYWRNELDGAVMWECSNGQAKRCAGF